MSHNVAVAVFLPAACPTPLIFVMAPGKFAMKAMKAIAGKTVPKVLKAHTKAAGTKTVANTKKDAEDKGKSFIPRELRFAKPAKQKTNKNSGVDQTLDSMNEGKMLQRQQEAEHQVMKKPSTYNKAANSGDGGRDRSHLFSSRFDHFLQL